MHSYEEPVYMISVVAKVLEVHPQTLRQYEREGLIQPGRSIGKVRLYSQRDIDEIRLVLSLTRDMGVNLAGVDIALKLKRQIAQMQKEIDDLKARLSDVNENGLVPPSKQIVAAPSRRIIVVEQD
ncbi:MAG: helix-turn-helix transcriptional regulator [Helicobacteraceae bacterium]|jgi:MerR family transcriptional regulator/heat shock protein HspR|nr:helix-turn-helix transcriptional regulator [Helicobacteraceae bacterium]MDR2034232.1 helix-turn-helix transcriptional regulator [Helicobacteraceae bacterium]